jgi:hypothetical protein
VVDPPYVTCSGMATATEAALAVLERLGPDTAASVRESLATVPASDEAVCESPSRYRPRRGRPAPVPAPRPSIATVPPRRSRTGGSVVDVDLDGT